MEARTWGIVGGVVFVIGLLYFFMGSSKLVEKHYADAETLYQHRDYQGAIEKYQKAIKASKKPGAKTKHIHKDFPGLANYKIALCFDKLGDTKNDNRFYSKAISQIEKTKDETIEYQLREKLYFLWAQVLHKTKEYVHAELKYSYFLTEFPNSVLVQEALYFDGTINKELLRYNDSQVSFQRIIDEFPTSTYRDEAEYHIPQLLVAKSQLVNGDHNNITGRKQNKQQPKDNSNLTALIQHPKSQEVIQSEIMYNTAIEKMDSRQDYEAYQLFDGIIKQYSNSKYVSLAYEGIGDIYNKSDNFVNARENYEAAMNSTTDENRKRELYVKYQSTYLVPEYSERKNQIETNSKLFFKANLLRFNGKFAEAAPIYEKLTKSEISIDDIFYALFWGGYCYYKAANKNALYYKNSVELFNRIIEHHGDNPDILKVYYYLTSVYSNWADAVGDKTKYQLAIRTIDKANEIFTELDNDPDPLWIRRMNELKDNASSFSSLQDSKPELEDVPKIDSQENQIDRHYDSGWAYLDQNLYDEAIYEFEKCIEIDPKFIRAYCNLGVIYFKKKAYTQAINQLKAAIKIDPHYKQAYFNLGLAYLKTGKYEDAKNAAKAALRIDPNYEAADVLRNSIAD